MCIAIVGFNSSNVKENFSRLDIKLGFNLLDIEKNSFRHDIELKNNSFRHDIELEMLGPVRYDY